MNDDFLKRHRQRPDPKFVERLHLKLDSIPNSQRSTPMFRRTFRSALFVTLALVLAAALTLVFSPAARAAVKALALLTFNGVTVSVDDQTGNLVTSGNPDAILLKSDREVVIKGENGDFTVVGVSEIAKADGKMIDVSNLLSQYPDLRLITAPAGYTLQSQGQVTSDGSLILTWTDAAGNIITYQRSTTPITNPGNLIGVGAIPAGSGSTTMTITTYTDGTSGLVEAGTLNPAPVEVVLFNGESGGYYIQFFTTDKNLTQADFQAMLP
jgi:hypothetical protein